MNQIIFEYKNALSSKVGKSVDERIWVLELMEVYKGLSYEYFTEIVPFEIFELMKYKLIADREKKK